MPTDPNSIAWAVAGKAIMNNQKSDQMIHPPGTPIEKPQPPSPVTGKPKGGTKV